MTSSALITSLSTWSSIVVQSARCRESGDSGLFLPRYAPKRWKVWPCSCLQSPTFLHWPQWKTAGKKIIYSSRKKNRVGFNSTGFFFFDSPVCVPWWPISLNPLRTNLLCLITAKSPRSFTNSVTWCMVCVPERAPLDSKVYTWNETLWKPLRKCWRIGVGTRNHFRGCRAITK